MGDGGSPEDRLIAQYFGPLATHPGTFGFTDDCAAIAPPPGHDLVLKTDGLIEGVHFFSDDPPDGVGPQPGPECASAAVGVTGHIGRDAGFP